MTSRALGEALLKDAQCTRMDLIATSIDAETSRQKYADMTRIWSLVPYTEHWICQICL